MIIIYPDYVSSGASYLADKLGIESVEVKTRTFPNKEVLVRISDVEKIKGVDKAILYFPTYPETNDRIMHLLQTLEVVSYYNDSAYKILISPYLSYSRQDKRFLEGESLSLKLYLDILCHLGLNHIVVFDVHNLDSFKKYVCCDYTHFSLFTPLVEKIIKIHDMDPKKLILVAPDMGRLETVEELSKHFGSDYMYLEKSRDRYTGEIIMKLPEEIDLTRYDYALIIDDEISTGGTMSSAINHLKRVGAKTVIAAAIHLLLVSNADDRLFKAGVDYLYGTNTIYNPYSILDIEEILVDNRDNWLG